MLSTVFSPSFPQLRCRNKYCKPTWRSKQDQNVAWPVASELVFDLFHASGFSKQIVGLFLNIVPFKKKQCQSKFQADINKLHALFYFFTNTSQRIIVSYCRYILYCRHTSRCWKRAAVMARPAAARKGAAWRADVDVDCRATVLVATAEKCRRVEAATACRLAARTAAEANIMLVV